MNRRLEGKTAVVTGVSRLEGMGAAFCRALAHEGASVFFTYYTPYDEEMPWGKKESDPGILLQELKDIGAATGMIQLDLASESSYRLLFDEAERMVGSPAILVNNACYSVNDSLDTITAAHWDKYYEINIRATAMLSAEFVRRWTGKTGGRIINITSGQSKGPMPGEWAYASTKGAIDAMTVTLSAEVASRGINVNAINPGPTDTGWMDADTRLALLPLFPKGRAGRSEDAARLLAFLASDESEWITGQILHSEGGFMR
ncbi:SDR family oxidoreductase [Fictibacillus fluitans]|uniref:SDR family oxidoreductase n=1 Tax=Fictibacillus fluitans TaxID=3058422 RepID=A0ABT8HXL7_9BACL|nr:SDR family oxidoreductase [Fictibacillus sp. NE201]MDN4525523.1 SDR family oxidoreductase [Fictibacillus sp. NE201]